MLSMWAGVALAQEVPPLPVPSSPPAKKFDLYLSGHVMGLFPQNKDLSVGGSRIPHTDVRGTIGAGIKFDAYPWFTRKILGAEIEAFGSAEASGLPGLHPASARLRRKAV